MNNIIKEACLMMLSEIMKKAAREHRRASTGEISREEFQELDKNLSQQVNKLFDVISKPCMN